MLLFVFPLQPEKPVTRPKTRTAALDAAAVKDLKAKFGTIKNAFLTLNPVGMTQDVFARVAAGRPSLPQEVLAVSVLFSTWKKVNLK